MSLERTAAARQSALAYRPHLDGVRAIAVALVIAFHAGYTWFTGGFVGVDVFFVLSGYLITSLLVSEMQQTGRVEGRRFYARRARRLLPASAAVLVTVGALSMLLLDAVSRASIATDIRASALYSANWRFVYEGRDYFAPGDVPSPLAHYWSLGVEEQFYLLWPAILIGVWWFAARRRGRGPEAGRRAALVVTVLLVALSAVLSVVLTPSTAAYYGTHTRAYELLCGALVALIATGSRRTHDVASRAHGRAAATLAVASVIALVWLAHAIPSAADYPGRAALAVTAASVALLIALELLPSGRVGRALGARPMAATGRLSYSLYLWHWPVLVFAPLLAERYGWDVLRNRPFELVLVVVISLASYHLLEQPIRFRLWRRAPAPAVVLAGLALSATIAVVAVPWLGPTSDASREALAAVKDLARPVNDCPYFAEDWPSPADSRPCLVRAGGPYTVALVGDSHAQMWAPTLDALAQRFGFTFVTVTRGGCPANDILVYHLSDEGVPTPDQDCSDWRDHTYRRLLADYHPDLVVMSTRSYVDGIVDGGRDLTPADLGHLQLWSDGFAREARLLTSGGATVLVSQILPTLPERVPACLAEHTSTTSKCDFPAAGDERRAAYNAAILALPSEVPNVRTFDPRTIVCPGDVCPARIDDVIVHRDDNHITATFAGRVVDQFLALLRSAGVRFG